MRQVPAFEITDARAGDVPTVVDSLVEAFLGDAEARYFFPFDLPEYRDVTKELFTVLMQARIAIAMPVLVLRVEGQARGIAMGNDQSGKDWLPEHQEKWNAFENRHPGLKQRFDVSEAIKNRFAPSGQHYYLGVVGLDPSLHGKGCGAALVNAFCQISDADPHSTGVYLETAMERNVRLYQRCGFDVAGVGDLDSTTRLWCLFRRRPD